MINLRGTVKEVMCAQVICVNENTIMTEVADIFDKNNFHHLPVINSKKKVVGIISKSEYYKLQNSLTLMKTQSSNSKNAKLLGSLLASEVMQKPITINEDFTLKNAIEIFLENMIGSLIVTRNNECVGILTPHDILFQLINKPSYLGEPK